MNRGHASSRTGTPLALAAGVLLLVACSPVAPASQLQPLGSPSSSPPPSSPPPSSVTFTVSGPQADKIALVVRFVTAFNGAQLDDALGLLAEDANISDCDFGTHLAVQAQGRVAIRSWLMQRFADHDRLAIARIFNMNPDSDRAVGVEFARRSSDTIARLGAPNGLAPDGITTLGFDASGQRIGGFANGPVGADPGIALRLCSVRGVTSPPIPTASG